MNRISALHAGLPEEYRPALNFIAAISACSAIAAVSITFARYSQVPAVLTALILGMVVGKWGQRASVKPGIDFSARILLRWGVALIGVRLSFHEAASLGWQTVLIAVAAVALMLVAGTAIGRAFGLSPARSVLSAGAVGICGASAALAVSSVLPRTESSQRELVFTIAAVTTLSTVVMLLYPLIARLFGLSDLEAGVFFGTSIHDVTQVLGAGAFISPEATEIATATKLIRVACLAPAVAIVGLWAARKCCAEGTKATVPIVPPFLLGFVGLCILANAGLLGASLTQIFSETATLLLVIATAALGMKTSLRQLAHCGWRPVAAAIAQTFLIGAYALSATALLIG